jgi:hypothetical protein
MHFSFRSNDDRNAFDEPQRRPVAVARRPTANDLARPGAVGVPRNDALHVILVQGAYTDDSPIRAFLEEAET